MLQGPKCCRSIVRELWGAEVVVCTLRGTLRVANVRGKTKNTATGRENALGLPVTDVHTYTSATQLHSHKPNFLLTHTCLTRMALSLLALTHLHCYLSAPNGLEVGIHQALAAWLYVCG